jgi:hypothetical protein
LRTDEHGDLVAGGMFDDAGDRTAWLMRITAGGASVVIANSTDLPASIHSLTPAAEATVVSGSPDEAGCITGSQLFAYDADLASAWLSQPTDGCYGHLAATSQDLFAMLPTSGVDGGDVLLARLTLQGELLATEPIGVWGLSTPGDEPATLLALSARIVLAGWLGTPWVSTQGTWIEARAPDFSVLWRDELPYAGVAPAIAATVDELGNAYLVVDEPQPVVTVDEDDVWPLRLRSYGSDGTLACDQSLGSWPALEAFHAVVATDGALWLIGADTDALSRARTDVPIARFVATVDPV